VLTKAQHNYTFSILWHRNSGNTMSCRKHHQQYQIIYPILYCMYVTRFLYKSCVTLCLVN